MAKVDAVSTPPPDGPTEPAQPDPTAPPPSSGLPSEPISLSKSDDIGSEPTHVEEPFDPYRFGAPDHPIPPEYAPPGYVPPQPQAPVGPPAGGGPGAYPAYQPYPTSPPPGQYGAPPGGQYGYPPPGQYGYPPPPPFGPYPQPKTGNGRAIAGLVLGIVAVVFFWLSILDAIPVILGLIFSILGLNESRRTGHGRGQAIAGIVLVSIGAVLAIILSIVIWSRIAPCRDQFSSGTPEFNNCVQHHF